MHIHPLGVPMEMAYASHRHAFRCYIPAAGSIGPPPPAAPTVASR